jgi:hypothetical protein
MRISFLASGLVVALLGVAAAALPLQGAMAKTETTKPHHVRHKERVATDQQDDDPVDDVAQAGQDLVNVVVNVGRTLSHALAGD